MSSSSAVQLSAQEDARYSIIRELVETERKYVLDLDLLRVHAVSVHLARLTNDYLQRYASSVDQRKLLDKQTIQILFSNVPPLLSLHRKFLVDLEGTLELPWQEQRWGRHFMRAVSIHILPVIIPFHSAVHTSQGTRFRRV